VRIAVIGAGALGLGFIAPLLQENKRNDVIIYDQRTMVTAVSRTFVPRLPDIPVETTEWTQEIVDVRTVYGRPGGVAMGAIPVLSMQKPDIVITCTPPVALMELRREIRRLPKETIVLCCENTYRPDLLLDGDEDRFPICYPAIAWVSAFRNGTDFWCDEGYLAVPQELEYLGLPVGYFSDYTSEYREKTILHNAMHAVLAYNGWADGCETIPDAASRPARNYGRLWDALREVFPSAGERIDRERERMEDLSFPDPIVRVARSPSRKLSPWERLPKLYQAMDGYDAAQWIVSDAIDNAIEYGRRNDPNVALWLRGGTTDQFRRYYCGLEE
jgi:hypothetical protein